MSSTQIEIPARVAMVKPACMSLFGENHRFAQSATAERRVDEFGDLLFLERLVDQFKG